MKQSNQTLIWIIVFLLLTVLPIFTLMYSGFAWIILPFSLWILIRELIPKYIQEIRAKK